MSVQLLKPLVENDRIEKANYGSIPAYLLPIANKYSHIYKVLITPQKTLTSGLCKTRILAPESFGTPGLELQNQGRIPATVPPTNVDDMRPCLFYVFGAGSQKFRTNLQTNTNHYTEVIVNFE